MDQEGDEKRRNMGSKVGGCCLLTVGTGRNECSEGVNRGMESAAWETVTINEACVCVCVCRGEE